MNIDEKLEESIENKYMKNDKGKNKMELTIEESVYILKRRDFNDYVEEKAIETLLTAYEKEKEKNKELNKLKGFEMLDIFNMGKQSSRQRIEFDYVDKDKIKAIIEELQEDIKYSANPLSIDNSKFGIKVLQSLLKEE